MKQQKDLTLEFWRSNVDRMLAFNDQPILEGAGSVSRENMERIAHERFDSFDQKRRSTEARLADEEDLKELERLEEQVKGEASDSFNGEAGE